MRPQSEATRWGLSSTANKDAPELELMNVKEAADVLGVSRPCIYAMLRDGILSGGKVGSAQLVTAVSVRERFNSPRAAGRPKKTAAAL